LTRPLGAAALALLASLALAQGPAPGLLYRDVTAEAGITFVHHAAPDKKFIVESMSGGVAMLDFDDDGLIDIYLTDSLTVATARDSMAARSALYRNRGDWKFEDVTDKAGVGHPGWAMGVCTADVDGDGGQPRRHPLEDRGEQPALRQVGHGLLRLRQRRPARPDLGQRPRLSPARQDALRGRPPATGSASCSTTTAGTAPSTKWRRSTGPSSWTSA
jgi:hypothetical protein